MICKTMMLQASYGTWDRVTT